MNPLEVEWNENSCTGHLMSSITLLVCHNHVLSHHEIHVFMYQHTPERVELLVLYVYILLVYFICAYQKPLLMTESDSVRYVLVAEDLPCGISGIDYYQALDINAVSTRLC